jgi:hypothetical protein
MVVLVMPADVRRNLMGAPSLSVQAWCSLMKTQQRRTDHRSLQPSGDIPKYWPT